MQSEVNVKGYKGEDSRVEKIYRKNYKIKFNNEDDEKLFSDGKIVWLKNHREKFFDDMDDQMDYIQVNDIEWDWEYPGESSSYEFEWDLYVLKMPNESELFYKFPKLKKKEIEQINKSGFLLFKDNSYNRVAIKNYGINPWPTIKRINDDEDNLETHKKTSIRCIKPFLKKMKLSRKDITVIKKKFCFQYFDEKNKKEKKVIFYAGYINDDVEIKHHNVYFKNSYDFVNNKTCQFIHKVIDKII